MNDKMWLPHIDAALCTGCGDCVIACPTHVLALADGLAVIVEPAACSYCGDCESVCPTGAITLPYQIVLEPG
jgi:NAD-dependent dihydropyrimidine dehydrogenase PreA subunit